MKTKLEDLKARRSALVARARSAEAQSRVQEAIGSMDVMDPTSELGRFVGNVSVEWNPLPWLRVQEQLGSAERVRDHHHRADDGRHRRQLGHGGNGHGEYK